MINKLKLYLILYPILHLVASILILLILRSIFFCNIVHAEDLQQTTTNIPNEKSNPYTKYIVIGIGVGIMAILIIWFKLENPTNIEVELSDDISTPVREYCVDLLDYSIQAISTTSQNTIQTPELFLTFCSSIAFKFMRENQDHQSFIYDLKSIILPANKLALGKDNSIFHQVLQCYAELSSQVSDEKKPLVENLGISHVLLRKPNFILDHVMIIPELVQKGELTTYQALFQTLAQKYVKIQDSP